MHENIVIWVGATHDTIYHYFHTQVAVDNEMNPLDNLGIMMYKTFPQMS